MNILQASVVKWLDHINVYGWILTYIYIINMLRAAMLFCKQMSFCRLDITYIENNTWIQKF